MIPLILIIGDPQDLETAAILGRPRIGRSVQFEVVYLQGEEHKHREHQREALAGGEQRRSKPTARRRTFAALSVRLVAPPDAQYPDFPRITLKLEEHPVSAYP